MAGCCRGQASGPGRCSESPGRRSGRTRSRGFPASPGPGPGEVGLDGEGGGLPGGGAACGFDCRVGGEPGFSSILRGWGAQAWGVPPAAPHASLLASLPLCEPRGVPGGVLRAVAGTVGVAGALWVLACLSNATHCWCLSLPTVGEAGREVPSPCEAAAELLRDGGGGTACRTGPAGASG